MKILTSKQISETELKLSNTFCQCQTGRKLITSMIFQDKFRSGKDHQLSEKCFDYMLHLVTNSLVLSEFVEDQIDDIILMTKACFRYFKIVTNRFSERYFLYKDLIKKQMKIWDNVELWRRWYQIEVENMSSDDMVLFNKSKDDYYSMKFFSLWDFIQNLNLDGFFIHATFEKLVHQYIESENERNNVLLVIEKSIKNSQYGTKK